MKSLELFISKGYFELISPRREIFPAPFISNPWYIKLHMDHLRGYYDTDGIQSMIRMMREV